MAEHSTATLDRYAVFGNPIAHSLSPRIHAAFAEQTQQALTYSAVLVELDGLAEAIEAFRAEQGQGLNITVPFKQQAWALANRRSALAERAGAVNTLWWDRDDILYGDNTDGFGLIRDLTHNHGVAITGRRVLLVGAGGAARGVLAPLLAELPHELVIANRTPEKASELASLFSELGPLRGCGFEALHDSRFDLVINATSAGLSGRVPPLPATLFTPDACAYDMLYGREPTAFMTWAQQQGVKQTLDGLGMLVEQAAQSFYLWRGMRPATAPVIEFLRKG